jgi:hypothetical protein
VALNWDDIEDLSTGTSFSYPPITLLLLLFFQFLSFGSIKIFMIWAGLLEIGLVFLIWFGMKKIFQKNSNSELPYHEEPIMWGFILLLFNPFWILHNIFSIDNCGYHITDTFFLMVFWGVIYCYEMDKETAAFICLGFSAAIKWFTLPALGLYPLFLLIKKDMKRFWRFVIIVGIIIFGGLIIPLFVVPGYLNLYLFYIQGGGNPIFEWVPLYIKIIPILVLTVYYIFFHLKKGDFLSITGWSLIIMFSFMFWARFYLRYLLGWLIMGHMLKRWQNKEFELPILNLTFDQHEMTFIISIIGTILTVLLLILRLV